MATLLHLDTSVFPDGASVSRSVTASFREAWQAQHPDGQVIYRDLNADPVPHLESLGAGAGFTAPADRTRRAGRRLRAARAADRGTGGGGRRADRRPDVQLRDPLDSQGMAGPRDPDGGAHHRRRGPHGRPGSPPPWSPAGGGGYGPGTPRENFEFVLPYLETVLGPDGFGLDVEFIVPSSRWPRRRRAWSTSWSRPGPPAPGRTRPPRAAARSWRPGPARRLSDARRTARRSERARRTDSRPADAPRDQAPRSRSRPRPRARLRDRDTGTLRKHGTRHTVRRKPPRNAAGPRPPRIPQDMTKAPTGTR